MHRGTERRPDNVVGKHDQVQVMKRSSPHEHDQRANDYHAKQAIHDDQMTLFLLLAIYQRPSYLV